MSNPFEQGYALRMATNWFRHYRPGGQQVFRLLGYAGVGKTKLAREIADLTRSEVVYAAPTGKAASVMRSKGCAQADTLHSLLYTPYEEVDAKNRKITQWRLNTASRAAGAGLIIVDECSMVDNGVAHDLLSFNVPVLCLGDPFQLPPVGSNVGFFMRGKPDIMLTYVHRQAADNPIIDLSTKVREGKSLKYGQYGGSQVVSPSELDVGSIIQADQVLAGFNDLRAKVTRLLRSFQGNSGVTPVIGDRLVCTSSNKHRHFYNGTLWLVVGVKSDPDDAVQVLDVESLDERGSSQPLHRRIRVHRSKFEDVAKSASADATNDMSIVTNYLDQFTYANVLTVHKAQGSQWDNVVIFDQHPKFEDYSQQWLYTALTRAAKTVTVVTSYARR